MMAPGFTPPFLQHSQSNAQGGGGEDMQQVPEAVAAHKLPTTQVTLLPHTGQQRSKQNMPTQKIHHSC